MAGHDHRLWVLAVKQLELLEGATPQVWVRGIGLWRAALELTDGVDRIARDREVALLQAQDHAHVAAGMAGREREADTAVAEEVEGAPEGRIGLDAGTVEVDQAVIEGIVVVLGPVAAQRGREPLVATRHSASLNTNVDDGK